MNHRIPLLAISWGLVFFAAGVMSAAEPPPAQKARPSKHLNLDKNGLALEGYDPVSYFPVGGGKPLKGSGEFTLTHLGATYHFANDKHRKLFEAAPEKFEPQYGGWCAYAMGAKGKKVAVDVTAFEIHEGRLFLFYVGTFNDTRKAWSKERATLLPQADANWRKLTLPESPPK